MQAPEKEKRSITPHKGGRSKTLSVRATPETVEALVLIKARTGETAADLLEQSALAKSKQLKSRRLCPEGHELKVRDNCDQKGIMVYCPECKRSYPGQELRTV